MNSVSPTVGLPHEIKIDESHRVLNPSASGGGYPFYGALRTLPERPLMSAFDPKRTLLSLVTA
jgi:hypothetical protein